MVKNKNLQKNQISFKFNLQIIFQLHEISFRISRSSNFLFRPTKTLPIITVRKFGVKIHFPFCLKFVSFSFYSVDLVTLDDLTGEALLESSQRAEHLAETFRRRQEILSDPGPPGHFNQMAIG